MVGGSGQRIHPPRLHPSNFELKRNASSLRSYLSKFVCIYIYIHEMVLSFFFNFLYPLLCGFNLFAVLFNSLFMKREWCKGWIPVDSFSEWIILGGGGWPVERSPLPRNLFKYYFIGYRKSRRELFLIRYFIVFNIPRYFLGRSECSRYWNYWKVVLFRKDTYTEREGKGWYELQF